MYDPGSPFSPGAQRREGFPQPEAKTRFAEDRLLDAVVWCEVLPGETITESDVMDRFGLTRAAARTALMRLGYDGWALPLARLGWQVRPVSCALIREVLTARRLVEPAALSAARPDISETSELRRLGGMLDALCNHSAPGAVSALRHVVDRIDAILLTAIDPFTARHLQKLWHHSARMTRYLEDQSSGLVFKRDEIIGLVEAVTARDDEGVAAARHALIDAQEAFFLRQIFKSDAALGPGSGLTESAIHAANNRRTT